MKNNKKNIKIFLSLLMIVFICFNSFSAIVSDNDGSAFVTKAEFDALKTSFNRQIDDYNASIDGKIDGAIAQYLSGITTKTIVESRWEKIRDLTGGDFWFFNDYDTDYKTNTATGKSTYTSGLYMQLTRSLLYEYWSNAKFWRGGGSTSWAGFLFITLGNTSTHDFDGGSAASRAKWMAQSQYGDTNKDGMQHWVTVDTFRAWENSPPGISDQGTEVLRTNKSDKKTFINSVLKEQEGKGASFVYHITPAGKKFLRDCCSVIYPKIFFNLNAHSYKNWYTNTLTYLYDTYTKNTMRDDTTSLTIDFSSSPFTVAGVTKNVGTSRDINTYTSSATWGSGYVTAFQKKDDFNYSFVQWGKIPSSGDDIVAVKDTFTLQDKGTVTVNASETESKRREYYYPSTGATAYDAKVSGAKVLYNNVGFNFEDAKLTTFNQELLTQIYGEDVMIGDGVPMLSLVGKDSAFDSIRKHVRVKFKTEDGSTVNVKFAVIDKKFNAGVVPTDAKVLLPTASTDGYVTISTSNAFEFDIDMESDNVWINAYNYLNNKPIGIEEFIVS